MKGTDFYEAFKQLEALEIDELINAVKAHGGKYVFIDENGDQANDDVNPPIIAGYFKYSEHPVDILIHRVELENGYLAVYGTDVEGRSDIARQVDTIEHGNIHYITEYLPDIPGVDITKDCPHRDYHIPNRKRFDFISLWLPDYSDNPDVTLSDDLECYLTDQTDNSQYERLKEIFPDKKDAALLQEAIDSKLYYKSYCAYKKRLGLKHYS